ncbi:AraC-like DNA-binding protein [Paenibacillus turicensis]|uniref:AraC-like DNA-binding protein n=1 Tax=Paenibacillus turicensis TaxID=160487 RepID=A0ABS4FVX7_9BACL|nr:AraC family transcriptional regulator [Paenibacillus turicensis]MBP1906741.1 AraC-like DNA-binding protein [Paenibacillus turicensis]
MSNKRAEETECQWLPELVHIKMYDTYPPEDIVKAPHSLEQFTLLLLVQGRTEIIVNGKSVSISAPCAYLLLPNTKLEFILPPTSFPVELFELQFQLYSLVEYSHTRKIFERKTDFPYQGRLAGHAGALQRAVLRLYTIANQEQANKLKIRSQMLYILELLLAGQDSQERQNVNQFMTELLIYMKSHYKEDITMEELAARAGMQASYFSQRFKQYTGKTPLQYLSSIRMNRAKEILLGSEYSTIREVARLVGYRDEFYFSRRFKELNGVAPSQYHVRLKHPTIISLSFPYTEHLLALKIVPIAGQVTASMQATIKALPLPYHGKEAWEISQNVFVEHTPDLVVCKNNVAEKARSYIGDVVPIVTYPWREMDVYGLQWRLATLLGREEEAKSWREDFTNQEKAARRRINSIGDLTVALCVRHERGWRMYGARNIGHVFYRSLLLKPPKLVRDAMAEHPIGTEFTWLSFEPDELLLFEADYIFFVVRNEKDIEEIVDFKKNIPAWRDHEAISREQYAFLDWDWWMIYAPLSLEKQLEAATLFVERIIKRRNLT